MEVPLLQLGPSQTYGTTYYADGGRIIAVEGGNPSSPPPPYRNATYRTFLDRLFKIDRVSFSPAAAAAEVLNHTKVQETPKRKPRRRKLASLLTYLNHKTETLLCAVNQLPLFGRTIILQKGHHDEPHTKTTRSTRTHSELPKRKWILANNAGTCRTHRREQGHSVRASRGTHPKGSIDQRTEQSTLFIDC